MALVPARLPCVPAQVAMPLRSLVFPGTKSHEEAGLTVTQVSQPGTAEISCTPRLQMCVLPQVPR